MGITKDVLEVIGNNNGITVQGIAEKTQYRKTMIRALLWRMSGDGRVVRSKVKNDAAKGPQSVFAYTLGEDYA